MLTEIEKSYLAGILDGEGSIQISEDSKSKYRRNCPRVSFMIIFDNTNLELLKTLKKWLDDSRIYSKIGSYERSEKTKIRHRLSIWRLADSLEFLSLIQPYVIVKKPQLQLALEYLKSRVNKLNSPPRTKILNSRERQIVKELHKVNKKGRI